MCSIFSYWSFNHFSVNQHINMKLNRMMPEERETLKQDGTWVLTIQKRRYKTLKLARWVHSNPGREVLLQYLGIGEPLSDWKPDPVLQKNPKIHTLFRATPSILFPCLGQRTKWAPSCFEKPVFSNCNRANSHYSHRFCILGVQTNFSKRIKSRQYPVYDKYRLARNYVHCLGQRGQKPYTVRLHFPV